MAGRLFESIKDRQAVNLRDKRLQYIKGVVALLLSVYLIISLISYDTWDRSLFTYSTAPVKNYGGVMGATIADFLFTIIGLPGYVIPLFLIIYGLRRIFAKQGSVAHSTGVMLFIISASVMAQLLSAALMSPVENAGGIVGVFLSGALEGLFSKAGTYIMSVTLIIVSLILMSPVSVFSLIMSLKERGKRVKRPGYEHEQTEPLTPFEPEPLMTSAGRQSDPVRSKDRRTTHKKKDGSGYMLPPLDLLKEASDVPGPSREELNTASTGLEKKLSDFGIKGKIRQAHPGPVVTMYEYEPAPGVKINKIVALSDDLALSLRAPSIRVYPIAGKATIGIEVPNRLRATVALRDVIASEFFQKGASLLTIALGKDIFGNPVVTDLSRMPHLLVAGATGSGKSVSINGMIMSILYKAAPDEVKMLLIDPKLLELSAYADIPHLISPVVTDPKEASDALKKVAYEMDRRYRLLAHRGARNIETYNRQVEDDGRLPYIVVFIDELADLMFTAPADVEGTLTRLAQMSRASGIHLIVATQRPSVDVITGLIKANFPARISFQVTSKIDSRTILDTQGAEQLLGMGDLLFMVPGVKIVRVHGTYVSESEVKEITDFVRTQGVPDYASFESIVVADDREKSADAGDERDELYERVIEFAENAGEVSISSIQRRFKIGYNRAARIMELLEEDGLVGPPKGAGRPRDFMRRR